MDLVLILSWRKNATWLLLVTVLAAEVPETVSFFQDSAETEKRGGGGVSW